MPELNEDITRSLNAAAIAMGAIGVTGILVGFALALMGKTVPAFIGLVVGQMTTGLLLLGRWTLSYSAGSTKLDPE